MPQVAFVGDLRVESWSTSDEDWDTLKGSYRATGVAMVCGQPGFPKTSRLGTKFFSHKPGALCSVHEGADESPEHMRAKELVAKAARSLGWMATVEYPATDRSWIADILLEKGGRKVAIEIQLSRQSSSDFQHRQERYESAGLECLWLAGPKNSKNLLGVPSRLLSGGVDDLELTLPHKVAGRPQIVPLAEGMATILRGEIQPRVEAISTTLEVTVALAKCWNLHCGRWLCYWFVSGIQLETRCGQEASLVLSDNYVLWAKSRVESTLQEAVRAAILASDLPMPTKYDTRFSKIAGTYYVAQNCPHCEVVQGDGFIAQDRRWTAYTLPHRARFPFAESVLNAEHLCEDVGNGRCSQIRNSTTVSFPAAGQRGYLEGTDEFDVPRALPAKGSRFRNRR